MALSVILRILFEKYIFEKYGKPSKSFTDYNTEYNKMYDSLLCGDMLSKKDIEMCEFAKIVANPYVHVNAFMYEQLIDNSADMIIECIKYFAKVSGF